MSVSWRLNPASSANFLQLLRNLLNCSWITSIHMVMRTRNSSYVPLRTLDFPFSRRLWSLPFNTESVSFYEDQYHFIIHWTLIIYWNVNFNTCHPNILSKSKCKIWEKFNNLIQDFNEIIFHVRQKFIETQFDFLNHGFVNLNRFLEYGNIAKGPFSK